MPEVRRLGTADLAAYKALRDEMLERHPDAFNSDAAEEAIKPAEHYAARFGLPGNDGNDGRGADPLRFTLGAFDLERGLAGVVSCERDGRLKVRHIAHVVGMMVRPHARRCGLGAALVSELVAAVRAAGGIERITLTVTSSNAEAVRLYERAGFVRFGRLDGAVRVGDRLHAKDFMVLVL